VSSWFFIVLGLPSVVITAIMAVVAVVSRRRAPLANPAAELPAPWPQPDRPLRCTRCTKGDLLSVPHITVQMRDSNHLEDGQGRIALELFVCDHCGRAEWFVSSPKALEPFRTPPSEDAPSIDASGARSTPCKG
jgi:hypothetical protein